jgi:hypothetical protein
VSAFEFGGEIAWRPTPEYIERSRLTAFMRKHDVRDYAQLMQRSTTDLDWFWRAVLDDLGIQFYEPYRAVLDTSRGIARTQWCVGGRMNIVHNCLDKWMGTPVQHRPALHWEGEEGTSRTMTYEQLRREVHRCANGLRRMGIGRGDRVALFMPMCPELVAAFFAVITVGGIVLPLFSGYGADAVASRLQDSGAKALFTADGFWRRGQIVAMKATADQAVALSPSVQHVIVVSRLGVETSMTGRDCRWSDLVGSESDLCEPTQTGADEPMMIIYTSGTTGRPKGAVHSHCGFPIKSAQDLVHCFDVQPDETMYWVSDMGWMMGPWEVVGMTLLGGTMVLYDGALDYPGPDRRATSREHSRRLTDADQVADAPRRGTGSPPRPVVAAHPRVNRRAVESGTLAVVLRCRREREAADHQLLRRNRSLRRFGRRQCHHATQAGRIRRPSAGYRCGRRGRSRQARAQPGRGARRDAAVDRHDPRLLERRGALSPHLLVTVPQRVGAWRLGGD